MSMADHKRHISSGFQFDRRNVHCIFEFDYLKLVGSMGSNKNNDDLSMRRNEINFHRYFHGSIWYIFAILHNCKNVIWGILHGYHFSRFSILTNDSVTFQGFMGCKYRNFLSLIRFNNLRMDKFCKRTRINYIGSMEWNKIHNRFRNKLDDWKNKFSDRVSKCSSLNSMSLNK